MSGDGRARAPDSPSPRSARTAPSRSPVRRSPVVAYAIVALLLASVIVLSACRANAPLARPLYSGRDGVILTVPDANALKQYPGSRFTVAVRLENDGAMDVNASDPGYLTVTYDPAIIALDAPDGGSAGSGSAGSGSTGTGGTGFSWQDLLRGAIGRVVRIPETGGEAGGAGLAAFALRGRAVGVPVGDVRFADFAFTVKDLSANRERAVTPLAFQACYPYRTTLATTVCVDRDAGSGGSVPACTPRPMTFQPQGAPVAFTTLDSRYTREGDRITAWFQLGVENIGTGSVVYAPADADGSEVCDLGGLERNSTNVIRVAGVVGGAELRCGQDGLVRLQNRRATFTCSLVEEANFGRGANYVAPLVITAEYFYIQRTTATLEVIR